MSKVRLSASVDEELFDLGLAAVRDGRVATMSEWVNTALALMAENDRLLDNGALFIAEYEAEHGVLTDGDMDAADRYIEERTITIGPQERVPKRPASAKRRRGAA